MKYFKLLFLSLILCFSLSVSTFAHSGRTDGSGGHKDNQNASGLGSYHYHHGYGPHLHPNGVCPYDAPVVAAVATTPAPTPVPTPAPTPTPTPKDEISISNQPSELLVGESITLDYNIKAYSNNNEVTFYSSDESVIKIEGATLTAISSGKATITATLFNGSYTFSILSKDIEAETISLDSSELTVNVGDEILLSTTVLPENTKDKSLTFSSSDDAIATVSNDGIVTFHSAGEVIITAKTSNGISQNITLTSDDLNSNPIPILILGGAGYFFYNKRKKKKQTLIK